MFFRIHEILHTKDTAKVNRLISNFEVARNAIFNITQHNHGQKNSAILRTAL